MGRETAAFWDCLKPLGFRKKDTDEPTNYVQAAEAGDRFGVGFPEPKSAELLLSVALAEREHRIAALGGLEAKTGILLGFGAVLVALSVELPVSTQWQAAVAVPALIAVFLCVRAMFTRNVPALRLKKMRDTYLFEQPQKTATITLNTMIRDDAILARTAECAQRTVTVSASFVFVSAFLTFLAVFFA